MGPMHRGTALAARAAPTAPGRSPAFQAGRAKARLRRVLWLAFLLYPIAGCDAARPTPSGPSDRARAALAVSLDDVSATPYTLGVQYNLRVRLNETAGGSGTILQIALSFQCTQSTASVTLSGQTYFPGTIGPNQQAVSSPVELPGGGLVCSRVEAAVTFFDGIGSATATGAAVIPPVTDPAATP